MSEISNIIDTLTITMDDGRKVKWTDYTEYEIRNGLFIVINGFQWVGIYNLSHVISVEVERVKVEV